MSDLQVLAEDVEFTGTILALDKETGAGRFRCVDGFEFVFQSDETLRAKLARAFGKKRVTFGGCVSVRPEHPELSDALLKLPSSLLESRSCP